MPLSRNQQLWAKREKELDKREKQLAERERILDERDAQMARMPEGELTDGDIQAYFEVTRKERLAMMMALAKRSTSEATRSQMLMRLDDMDLGKPVAKKRTDSDEVDGVSIISGKYGVKIAGS